jgi:hypothetical protein
MDEETRLYIKNRVNRANKDIDFWEYWKNQRATTKSEIIYCKKRIETENEVKKTLFEIAKRENIKIADLC